MSLNNYIIQTPFIITDHRVVNKLSSMQESEVESFLNLMISTGYEVFSVARTRGEAEMLRGSVRDWFQTFGNDFQKKILDENIKKFSEILETEGLEKLKFALIEKLEETKTEILTQNKVDAAVDDALQMTPQKGFDFEEVVTRDLERFAKGRFDSIEVLGTSTGHGSSKKGDLIYRDGLTNGRIVLELKNYDTSLSFPKIRSQIEESIQNRNAQFCIFVVASNGCLPESIGEFFYENNFIITTYKNLEIALKFALVDIFRQSRAARASSLDVEELNTELSQVVSLIGMLDKLSNGIKSSQKSLSKVDADLLSIKDDIHLRIKKLLSMLKSDLHQKDINTSEVNYGTK